MRLQRLEIAGFKSFSDRSELAFDDGVTAIVGPNGCGKSNVADAITWVLGEQSAKSLRGDRMEDVIFNGSDARKPTGSAEVRLLLTGVTTPANGNGRHVNGNGHANGNGNGHAIGHANGHANGNGHGAVAVLAAGEIDDEVARKVEVTRRLYRSGESEYLIDGHQCRLRDIHELLMDTGLGAKAYAIIEQGKIGMILSSRPADRRQLIEEAAGITKYKARRRTAELKLEAAQQNLTRVDDIIFEVEKQRGTLKRQAAKARRYRRLRDELRRWEKVLLAGRYRELMATMARTRERLSDARAREAGAAARVAEFESTVARVRIELSEAETCATAARESAHTRELELQRRQQQIELDRQQGAALEARIAELDGEVQALEARREPARVRLEERRTAARDADVQRQEAQKLLSTEQEGYQTAASELDGLDGDVEAARSEMFAAGNAATALQHALQHAATARERVSETLSKLGIELRDVETEGDVLARARQEAEQGLQSAQWALAEAVRRRATHDAALTAARAEHDSLSRLHRQRDHELAGLSARLRSLEELEAARAGYGDAARTVLAAANGAVGQLGAVADYLDVDRGYERAAEAVLGDLLQHVVVPTHGHAEAGLRLVREHAVGRCGFLVLDAATQTSSAANEVPGARRLSDVVRVNGPHAAAVLPLIDHAWIAETYAAAVQASTATGDPVATPEGDVVRGNGLVFGGAAAEARGILATKAEIRELRDRVQTDREEIDQLATRVAGAATAIAGALAAVDAAGADLHRQEKAIVAFEAQMARIVEEEGRLGRKSELLGLERARAEEEGVQLDRRQTEARESIVRIEAQQREADDRFTSAQRRLFLARERLEALGHRVSEAKAAHAGLVERSAALSAEVVRLEDTTRELETRVADLRTEREQKSRTRGELSDAVARGLRELDEYVRTLDDLRQAVRAAEELVTVRHADAEAHEVELRSARSSLDAVRNEATELEVARATAESDLNHLAGICAETLQSSVENVLGDVEQMERDGSTVPDAQALAAAESEDGEDSEVESQDVQEAQPPAPSQAVLTAEDAITALRAKIDRLGPVNMMAIEQFDELETRHTFLTTQRKDLVDSIAQTVEAITRIDETSKARFKEAFQAINVNFQVTFATLFGGGRAGLTLLDDADPLESGIDIVASPPGKRLQSVQLLSGGEKALTAIALMFAIFKYKPSPFCLLDEIDAPLDDANIGRFVEMLKGMLHHTQFILITHNRKTMEIADRLYGVTMEEPGVSKLISVRLN